MSRLPEQKVWDAMRNSIGHAVRLERIENRVGSGRPDVDTLYAGRCVPVELKAVPAGWPARDSTPVLPKGKGVRLAQRNWHLDWRRWGGRSLIVVGVFEGYERQVFVFEGRIADNINEMTRNDFITQSAAQGWSGLRKWLTTTN